MLKVVPSSSPDESWVIDPSGSQYGFKDVLIPLEKYLADTDGRVTGVPYTYDATETTDVEISLELPWVDTPTLRKDLEIEWRARVHFAAFADNVVEKDILAGSDAEFEAKLEELTRRLEEWMMRFYE